MKEQFVTYEIALKLKELGFDEPCLAIFEGKDLSQGHWDHLASQKKASYIYETKSAKVILAPLWQQVIKWIREKHLDVIISSNLLGYGFIIYHRYPPKNTLDNRVFQTYEEAQKEAILKALELIK